MSDADLSFPVNLRDFPAGAADPRRPDKQVPHPGQPGEKRGYGIQFSKALTPEDEDKLRENNPGLSLDTYVSKFTYIVLVDEQTLKKLRDEPSFYAAFRYEPGYKISPGITKSTYQTDRRKGIAPDLLLWAVLFRNADVDTVVEALTGLGARGLTVLDDREQEGDVRIEFIFPSHEEVPTIAEIEDIRWIEEVPEAQSNSPAIAGLVQSGIPDTTPYWDRELRGQGQIIGVLDEGVLDIGHCWFKDEPDNTPRLDHRKVVNDENAFKRGDPGHCAFVAGILAGDDIGNPNGHPDRGVACDAKIAYGNRRDFEEEHPKNLLDYLASAYAAGACIHTNSWHYPTSSPNYTQRAADFDQFTWTNEDCLVIGSSGNAGEDRGPPGTAKNTLCVSAGYIGAGISCFGDGIPGPTEEGLRKPDLLAPGCGTTSASAGSECGTQSDKQAGSTTPAECDAGTGCATSYAAPVVAAAAAIVRQYFVEGWYPAGNRESPDSEPFTPTGALLKAVLLNAARKTTACPDFPSDKEGWGLLQLEPILHLEGGIRKIWVQDIPHARGLRDGDDHPYTVTVAASDKPLKVTLVWTDYPAPAGANPVFINDLDLEVTAPNNGATYKGNGFAQNVSVPGGDPDRLNTVEMVYIETPEIGAWTITVKGTEVGKGKPGQGYALVVSGGLE